MESCKLLVMWLWHLEEYDMQVSWWSSYRKKIGYGSWRYGLINPHLDFPGTFASCSDHYKFELASTRYDVLMYQWDKEFFKKNHDIWRHIAWFYSKLWMLYIFNDYLIYCSWDFCSDRAIFLPAIKLRKLCGPFRNWTADCSEIK